LATDRNKRKNENLANQMLGSGARKPNAPSGPAAAGKDRRAGNGPSLASRMGVTKVRSFKKKKLKRASERMKG